MKIQPVRLAVGVGVGALDTYMEKWDADKARTGAFKTATDIGRAAMFVVGLGMQYMGYQENLAEALAQSATPLLTKSVWNALKGMGGTPAGVPMHHVYAPADGRVGAYQPGFENIRLV